MSFEAVYYSSVNGNCPVKEFIDGLNPAFQKKFFAKEERLLSAYGENLPPPHVHHLGDGIYELQVSFAKFEFRYLYFRKSNFIIFVHAFIKKVQKVPPHEIELAKQRKKDFLTRLESGQIKL